MADQVWIVYGYDGPAYITHVFVVDPANPDEAELLARREAAPVNNMVALINSGEDTDAGIKRYSTERYDRQKVVNAALAANEPIPPKDATHG